MKGTIISLDTNGEETVVHVNGLPLSALIKAAIGGGSLEVVPFFSHYTYDGQQVPCVAFCDANGKDNAMQYNDHATMCWEKSLTISQGGSLKTSRGEVIDYLVGKIAILFGDDEFMGAI